MAKTRAPLLSVAATGSLANVLVMSRGRRQPYTKYLRRPNDPKTLIQLGRRAWFKGLANAWTLLPQASKDSWIDCPTANEVSLYNAYMSYNLQLIDRGLYPTSIYPWLGTGPPGDVLSPTLTPGPRHIKGSFQMTAVNANWLLLIYMDDSPPPAPTTKSLVRVVTRQAVATETYIDAPLHSGAWYYQGRTISTRGNPYLWGWAPSASVP